MLELAIVFIVIVAFIIAVVMAFGLLGMTKKGPPPDTGTKSTG